MDLKTFSLVLVVIFSLHIQYAVTILGVGLVRFSNSICRTPQGYDGICIRRDQCTYAGGLASGPCANGIGRCCLFQGTCGGTSSNNNTYFFNSGFPNTATAVSQCIFTIIPESRNICQIRLDFLSLVLAQPDGNGNCIDDSMVITGAASVVPVICGENSGQHIYLTVDGTNPIQIVISTGAAATLGRSWNIKVTQIGCDCPTLAPTGCLQYYTALTNTVNSFNYDNGLNGNLLTQVAGTVVAGTRQIANQRYSICVGMIPGYCSIRWAQAAGTNSFSLTEDTAAAALMPGLPGSAGVGEDCTTDYVVIPNPFMTTGAAVVGDRFCGNLFNTVTTFSKPFVLNVVTDADEGSDAANRGFSLTYTQVPCSTTSNLFFTG